MTSPTPSTSPTPVSPPAGRRANQKLRTRRAIVEAAAELSRTGREVSMPEIAAAALVSEATAYRYFPDLVNLLREAIAGQLPDPAEALAGVEDCADPVERVAAAAEFLLRHVLARQGVVRAMIAGTITRPERSGRPGLRFGLIDHALGPLEEAGAIDPVVLEELKRGLAVVVSAEALFNLIDLYGLDPQDAIASVVRTARTLTRAAMAPSGGGGAAGRSADAQGARPRASRRARRPDASRG